MEEGVVAGGSFDPRVWILSTFRVRVSSVNGAESFPKGTEADLLVEVLVGSCVIKLSNRGGGV